MEKAYYILIDGQEIPVSEEVYRAYKQPVWRESKRIKVRAEHEYSYEAMLDEGMEIADSQKLVEEIIEDQILLDMLYTALDQLTGDERDLIEALFQCGQTEREAADALDISHQAVHKKKIRILEKLRKLLT